MANQPYFDPHRMPTRTRIRRTIEEEFDGCVLIRTGGGTKQVMHAPRLIIDERPLCMSETINGEWIEKSLNVYPYGHRDWCKRCLVRMFPERSNLEGAYR